MPVTFEKIASIELASNATNITIDSIPSTYKDLCVMAYLRDAATFTICEINFNNVSTLSYKLERLNVSPSQITAIETSATGYFNVTSGFVGDATYSQVGATEIYIPNYTSSNPKGILYAGAYIPNGNSYQSNAQQTWGGGTGPTGFTSAITSISLRAFSNFLSTSRFYLYGINYS